jgi:branched-chain amino acid transport system ATP-binding protein
MVTEEREVLPLAEEKLTPADWEALDNLFTAHDDPLFGDKPTREFSDLASRIVNQAPAPHGLGGYDPL